ILEYELGIGIFRIPGFESLDVKDVIANHVDVNVYFHCIILVFQIVRHKGVCSFYAINKIGPALYHSLIDQFFEWFILAYIAKIIEELVPESCIEKVTCSMFSSSDIEVYILPVLVSFLADQCFSVTWIHIAQIVC